MFPPKVEIRVESFFSSSGDDDKNLIPKCMSCDFAFSNASKTVGSNSVSCIVGIAINIDIELS